MQEFDVRTFLREYFEKNDDAFMNRLDEVIGSSEDPVEISALADWVFRNYIVEAFSEALEENNRNIYQNMERMIRESVLSDGASINDKDKKFSFPSPPVVEIKSSKSVFNSSSYITQKLPELPQSLKERLDL